MKPAPAEVLLVEDSAAEARLAQEALRESLLETRLHVVRDGHAALQFLQRSAGYADAPRPDLVLLDLNLPGCDGREVLREIKADESLRRIPVVILTNSQAPSDILRAYELHANCYVHKPLDLDCFIETIKSIHRFWLQLAVLPA